MKLRIALSAVLLAPLIGFAQANPEPAKAPATKLEAFQARSGTVVVKTFTTAGAISGKGASIEVDARELRDASNPKIREQGIVIEVKEHDRVARTSRAFIDYDEIDSLLKGIDYISKLDAKTTGTMKDFEAEYRTRGGLTVTAFTFDGKILYAVSTRLANFSAHLDAAQVMEFRKIIVDAKTLIEAARKT